MKKSIMIVVPYISGGTKRHASEMASAWLNQGYNVVFVVIHRSIAEVSLCYVDKRKEKFYFDDSNKSCVLQFLKACSIGFIHYHHFFRMSEFWCYLWKSLNVHYAVTLHDYYTICPEINCIGTCGSYCGVPKDEKKCNDCIFTKKAALIKKHKTEITTIKEWRDKWHYILEHASYVFVPNMDVENRMKKIFKDIRYIIFENPEIIGVDCPVDDYKKKNKSIIRIGVIGVINKIKGLDAILTVARYIENNELPIKIIVFGILEGVSKNYFKCIEIKGKYVEQAIYKKIIEESIDFFWFPGICPETYSYVLSIPIRLKIPVLGVNLGAIGKRILDNHWGEVYERDITTCDLCNRLSQFDYIKYKESGELCLKNTSFPKAENLYLNEELDAHSIEYTFDNFEVQNRKRVIDEVNIKNLTAIDLKFFLNSPLTWKARIQMISKIDIKWLISYLTKILRRVV